MIPDFAHDIRARDTQRASLGQAVERYRAAGGSISVLPAHMPATPRIPKDYQSAAPRARGIAAESRSRKRAADQHAAREQSHVANV